MKKLMSGNEAIARGAYEAGVKVASAYPGTPSTEITENISGYREIYSEWAPNEKVAAEMAFGACIAGARSICAMKHVGLNVAADLVFTAAYAGVNSGMVIAVADDPGIHSSQNEQDSRHYALAAKIPMLEPSDSQECLDYVKKAFEISEEFDTPVFVRLTTRIAHSQSIVETGECILPETKTYRKDTGKYVMMPSGARGRRVFVEKRMKRLREYSSDCGLNTIEWGGRELGVITSGICYQYARGAFGDSVSYLKLGMVYPMPDRLISELASGVKKLLVVEELDPFIETHVRSLGYEPDGKNILPAYGEINAAMLAEKDEAEVEPDMPDVPVRPPVLCPGCPHRGIFRVLNKMKLNVFGDIGCYTLGALPPLSALDTCINMGAGVSMIHGAEKACGKSISRTSVAVIGDSTFIHSGITALIDIVYNKGTSTIIVLDNLTTGMTGHQHNPMSGCTIKGEETVSVDLEAFVRAIGVNRVRVIDPFDMAGSEKAIREELEADEPSVIIARRPCVLLKSVKIKAPLFINTFKCLNCKKCMLIGCPAISFDGTSTQIDGSVCTGCGLCRSTCVCGAIEGEDA